MTQLAIASGRCVHHWMLGNPRSGLVEASCKKCGKARTYNEDVSGKTWARRTTRTQGAKTSRAG